MKQTKAQREGNLRRGETLRYYKIGEVIVCADPESAHYMKQGKVVDIYPRGRKWKHCVAYEISFNLDCGTRLFPAKRLRSVARHEYDIARYQSRYNSAGTG